MSQVPRSRRVRALFEAAFDLPEADRPAFLRGEAADDPTLVDEVLDLYEKAKQDMAPLLASQQPPAAVPSADDEAELYRIVLGAPEAAIDAELAALAGADPQRRKLLAAFVARLRTAGAVDGQGEDMLRRLRKIWSPARHARRYETVEALASGGFGAVSLVHDHLLGRRVAYKTIHAGHGASLAAIAPELVHRFLDEVQAAAQLSHPVIPPVHDVGVTALGVPFFTMRHLRGVTLHELIARHEDGDAEWPLARLVRVVADVAAALAHAHDRRVIHRDVKPGNVMVGRFGEVCLLDWGMARLLSVESWQRLATKSGLGPKIVSLAIGDRGAKLPTKRMGTPGYTAPEQLHGKESSNACDVFSVGAMLYRILARCEPPGDPADLPAAVLPPAAIARDRELAAVAATAMARAPDDRYQTMALMRDDLEAWLAGRAVSVVPRTLGTLLGRSLAGVKRRLASPVAVPPPTTSSSPPHTRAMATAAELDSAERQESDEATRAAVLQRVTSLGPPAGCLQDLGELASGGGGVVRKGLDQRMNRKIAIKRLRADGGGAPAPAAVDAFFDEACIAAQLDHPSIVGPHDVAPDGEDSLCMLLPWARGGSLEDCAADLAATPGAWRKTVPLLLQACRGLAFAHAKGVVHRDVKPANILLGQHGDAYLADWGLARLLPRNQLLADGSLLQLDSKTLRRGSQPTADFRATLEYASPEQANGEAAARTDDVFAAGGVLFRLLAGRPPRTIDDVGSPDPAAWRAAARQRPIRPVGQVASRVPKPLAEVCDRALAFAPEARHVDAAAFALALENALLRLR